MMKLLITYSSKTGNTKKLAEGIWEGFKEEATICPISEVESIEAYDAILVGYWVDKGGPNEEAANFLKTIKGKKVGIFATLGAYPDSEHAWKSLVNGENLVKENNEVVGKYICQGPVDPRLLERFKALPAGNPHAITKASKRRHAIAAMHPNETDLKAAMILFKERLA